MDNTVWEMHRANIDGVLFRTSKVQRKKKTKQTIHVWLDMLKCEMITIDRWSKNATGSYSAYICTSCTHPHDIKLTN
jgi:hypothetical protein